MSTTRDSGNKKKGHANKLPNRRYGYFRDDQITFLVTHPTDTLQAKELETFTAEINNYFDGQGAGKIEDLPRTFSFPALKDEESKRRLKELIELERSSQDGDNQSGDRSEPFLSAFSVLVCDLVGGSDEPVDLLNLITNLRHELGGQQVETLKVEDISPNWLMSVASQGAGTGGPGGLPSPFRGNNSDAPYQFTDFINRLESAGLYDRKAKGSNLDVAILDTAPCPHDLVLAAKEEPNKPLHDLIAGLLGPMGKLQLYPATYEELKRMGNTSLNRHDYKMTDHGLFATGIIHSLVPEANIHLIEVLNQFGIGDLESLAGGMRKVIDEIYKPGTDRHLVVNCSWMLELPLSGDHTSAMDEEDPEYDFEQAVLRFVKDERDKAFTLRTICNNLYLIGAQVVAAAGNDWNKKMKGAHADDQRINAPEARYPAAFVSAIGVGALPKDVKPDQTTGKFKASTYSNLGDKPAGLGIMTLGGEEGREKGVLGIYLEEKFPVELNPVPIPESHKRKFNFIERQSNENNHWAWWAGTSFATPILTGTIAAVLSSIPKLGDTQNAIEKLYSKNIILNAQTDADEDVMAVTQGK